MTRALELAALDPVAGLGKAYSDGIVAQGGEVVAGENPGGGAVFTVYLPHEAHEDVPNE